MPSEWWKYFERVEEKHARCLLTRKAPHFPKSIHDEECSMLINCAGSSTSGMKRHCLNVHNLSQHDRDSEPQKNASSTTPKEYHGAKRGPKTRVYSAETSTPYIPKPKNEPKEKLQQSRISFTKRPLKKSMDEILARAAAVDGILISSMLNSNTLKAELSLHGHEMPASFGKIKAEITRFYNSAKEEYRNELLELKKSEKKFSITTDEWVNSLNLKKYLNITLHSNEDYFVLALQPLKRTLDAQVYIEMITGCLQYYGLNTSSDIVGSTANGSSTVRSYEHHTKIDTTFCLVDAIQTAIIKVIYVQKELFRIGEHSDDFTNSNASQGFDCDLEDIEPADLLNERLFRPVPQHYELNQHVNKNLIALRHLINYLKSNPTNDGILQAAIQAKFGETIPLKLDIPNRWHTIVTMIKRVFQVKECIEEFFAASEYRNVLDNVDFQLLEELIVCLEPLEMAILKIGQTDSDLLISEGVIKYVVASLNDANSSLSGHLLTALQVEITNRREKNLISLMKFLENSSFDFLQESTSDFLAYANQNEIMSTADRIYGRLFAEPESSSTVLTNGQSSSERKPYNCFGTKNLDFFINMERKSKVNSQTAPEKRNIRNEFTTSISSECLTPKLYKLHNALLTIKPTALFCEQSLPISNIFSTDIQHNISDEFLSVLVFLKYYFAKKEKDEGHKRAKTS